MPEPTHTLQSMGLKKDVSVRTWLRADDLTASYISGELAAKYDPADEVWLRVFFTPSEQSQAAGRKETEHEVSCAHKLW